MFSRRISSRSLCEALFMNGETKGDPRRGIRGSITEVTQAQLDHIVNINLPTHNYVIPCEHEVPTVPGIRLYSGLQGAWGEYLEHVTHRLKRGERGNRAQIMRKRAEFLACINIPQATKEVWIQYLQKRDNEEYGPVLPAGIERSQRVYTMLHGAWSDVYSTLNSQRICRQLKFPVLTNRENKRISLRPAIQINNPRKRPRPVPESPTPFFQSWRDYVFQLLTQLCPPLTMSNLLIKLL